MYDFTAAPPKPLSHPPSMSSAAVFEAGGGALDPPLPFTPLLSHRDPDADRGTDHYGPGAGGKKRKVPAFPQASGPSGSDSTNTSDDSAKGSQSSTIFPANVKLVRSDAAKACSFKKALFLRRKAALVTLYLDAQTAVSNATSKGKPTSANVPKVPDFEKLIPALEDLELGGWEPDNPGWRNGWVEAVTVKAKPLEGWRMGYRQRKESSQRKAIARGGWAPEGSFEFEMASKGEV
jgi:hypothetical protein